MENRPLTRKGQLLELLVFLFLILPSLVLSFFIARRIAGAGFLFLAGSIILRDLALLFLVLYFVWRNGEHSVALGLTSRNLWKEAGTGVAVFIPVFVLTSVMVSYLHKAGLPAPPNPLPIKIQGVAQYVLAIIMIAVVAVAEESIFRGYLILRLEAVTASPAAAVVLSAMIFTAGHGYEGLAQILGVFVVGLVYALVYLWRKSLTATITMHFLQDFIGIVVVQMMKRHA